MPNTPEGTKDWTSLRAWGNVIAQVGIPGSIAILFTILTAIELPKLTRAVDQLVLEMQAARELAREHNQKMETLTRVTRQACRNSAKDEYVRSLCDN
jgi:hypothetical protein